LGRIHIVWDDYTNINNCGDDLDIFYRARNETGDWSDMEGEDTLHTCYKENEAEGFFENSKIVYKEKREQSYNLKKIVYQDGYLDYIVEK